MNANTTTTKKPFDFLKQETFFFTVDYKATRLAIKEFIDVKNKELHHEIIVHNLKLPVKPRDMRIEINQAKKKGLGLAEQDALRREIKLFNKNLPVPPRSYQSECFKISYETTVWAILDMYAAFLKRNSTNGFCNEHFLCNNEAVKHRKSDRMDRATTYRHIMRALTLGIFTEKTFRGSNTSFILNWNLDLIKWNVNIDYNKYLIKAYRAYLDGNGYRLPLEATKRLYAYKPKSSELSSPGSRVATCNDTHSILKLEHKINIESGIVHNDWPATAGQSVNNVLNFSSNWNKACDKDLRGTPPVAAAPPATGPLAELLDEVQLAEEKMKLAMENKTTGKTLEEQTWTFTIRTYAFLISVLYPERTITNEYRALVCHMVYRQFKKELKNTKIKDPLAALIDINGNFLSRILLTRKYLDRNPLFNLSSPLSYMDLNTTYGFNKTADWLAKSNVMREKNKEYLSHHKKLIKLWTDYTRNPSIAVYSSIHQQLGKLKNPCWVNYFNQCVANSEKINSADLQAIWKQNYNAA